MTKKDFLPALIVLASCATQPDAESTALAVIGTSESEATFFGDSYMFALATPHGWVADDEVARDSGIDGVFYPAGSSWSGPVAIYPRVWQKDSRLSYEDVIAQDLQHYQSEAPDLQYQEAQAVDIPGDQTLRAHPHLSIGGARRP